MDIAELLEPFTKMIQTVSTSSEVRRIERGGQIDQMWSEIEASGFLDALVGEDRGGPGLRLADLALLIETVGANAVPLPVAETIVVRGLLAQAKVDAPRGPIVIASSLAHPVPCALTSEYALVDSGQEVLLASTASLQPAGTGISHNLSAWLLSPKQAISLPRSEGGLRPLAASIRAALIAGAAERLTEMSANYAKERVQFGKPIGKQQAIQQMLAVMAEDMIACRIAARTALSKGLDVSVSVAATAKITTSIAAARIAASAHAVHGAIGISEEHDLQLLVRRLHEWRLADGSESYWASILGKSRLSSNTTTLDWVRSEIA